MILVLLSEIWRVTSGKRQGAWLVIFLFLATPIVAFVFTDNFLEVTLTLFTLTAILCQLKSLTVGRLAGAWALAGGLATVAAVLTKGPVGLFPITSMAVLAWMHRTSLRTVLRSYRVFLAVLLIAFVALYVYPESRQDLTRYFESQLVTTFDGTRLPQHGRGYLL